MFGTLRFMEETSLGSRVAVYAVYARYSSSRQNERSIEDQVRRCREFVALRNGDADTIEVFADFAVSGRSMARRGFEDLMLAVENRKVSSIVTEDISRIATAGPRSSSRGMLDLSFAFKAAYDTLIARLAAL